MDSQVSFRRTVAGLVAVSIALAVAGTADAAYPGRNGKIAFSANWDGNYDIYRPAAGTPQPERSISSPSTRMEVGARLDSEGNEIEPDWQPIPGPRREDYKNASAFCAAERAFFGDEAFALGYGGGPSAFGKCVSAKR